MISTTKPSRYRLWVFFGLVILGGFVLIRFADLQPRLQAFINWVGSLGAWGPLVFAAAYILATVLLVPGSALTLGAGLLFGVVWGSLYVSIASTLGACAAFLVARYCLREAAEERIRKNMRFEAINRAVSGHGWKIVFLTRLSPILPFTFLNYAFGLTRVRFWDYLTASWLGMLPGTVLYVYFGAVAKEASAAGRIGALQWLLYLSGFAATVVATVVVSKVAKRALDEQMQRSGQ